VARIPTMTLLIGDKFIFCPWFLVFLNTGSEVEYDDAPTVHESLEPSELKTASITPLGLPGISSYFRL